MKTKLTKREREAVVRFEAHTGISRLSLECDAYRRKIEAAIREAGKISNA